MIEPIQSLLLGILIAAALGPVSIEIIRRGLSGGFSSAILAGLGALSADLSYVILIYLGLSDFLEGDLFSLGVWFLGAAVLFYLAFLSIAEARSKVKIKEKRSSKSAYVSGFLVAITSPVTALWWFGMFGLFLSDYGRDAALGNCLLIVLGAFLWFFGLSMLLHYGRRYVSKDRMKHVSGLAGIALMAFAAYFLYKGLSLLSL